MAEVGIDRISALPEEIKVSILSYLPITDAIRTSALCHSWQHLWTFLPGFHAHVFYKNKGPGPKLENLGHILSSLSAAPFATSPSSATLITNAPASNTSSTSSVKRAVSAISLSTAPVICPALPGDFGGFNQLTSLKLYDVCISQPDFQSLIDGSEKLTSIKLFFDRIMSRKNAILNKQPLSGTFNCPLLKYLGFDFAEEYSVQPKMIYAPCLDSVDVTASTESCSHLKDLVWIGSAALKFMADIAHISPLSLNFNLLMCLSQVDMPHTLRAHFQQLRCLKLIGQLCDMDQRMFKVLCCLLKSMPSLENLKLQCHEPWRFEKAKGLSEYKKKEDGYLCLNQTLRTVAISIKNLRSLEDIIWIMHFILLNMLMFLNSSRLHIPMTMRSNQDCLRICAKLRKLLPTHMWYL
ncbi:F-box/FBD-like domain protein [Rhynchospora pubera]|uniref:F-box/FBD-like domain protein n=1 Tax=Rhynchospora pubera TaxID=906938 RepID=A0AAV8GEJ9_9POAL|nr:F-box/FBD-like domain protein [Rhynchospora pubera]